MPKSPEDIRLLNHSYQPKISVSWEVPAMANYYTWKVVGTIDETVVHQESLPVFYWRPQSEEFKIVGTIALGTEVELNHFINRQGKYFYRVNESLVQFATGANIPQIKDSLFIDGQFISRDEENSYKPVKIVRKPPPKKPASKKTTR